ncbi:probable low-specificity L-threonine aldolase 2 isoform X5 [Mesocricetus auratus]|uniref:Probable low-specificity L-threonine aldolase 2 isoform X5 n=1 Tax=Mesocricetus auratus TaxID=10036 RepID=A0ABM2XXV0_MESAU|nr:probable low-specificity L-threonine aldolase 2 isoform X5 [Mesocricetus auratus]
MPGPPPRLPPAPPPPTPPWRCGEEVCRETTGPHLPGLPGKEDTQNCRRRLQSCSGCSGPCLCPPTPWPTSSLIAGVHSQPLPDMPHGTLDLDELERALTRGFGSSYHPVCELVCLENTHSSAGGRVLPIDYLRQVRLLAHTHGARVHLDGARLMNAAVALRVPPARLVEHCDSVSFCLSKGLGAPVGALVGGSRDFIEEAWRLRKALGGGMRQAGVLAAAALVGLAEAEEVLPKDHENAQRTPGPGITRLLCGPCHRGDQHSAGAGVWAASRRAVPAPAGCERRRGGSDWLCRERVAVSLDGALRAGCVAPRRIRSGHRTGPEEVGVCAEAVAALRRRDPGVRRPG